LRSKQKPSKLSKSKPFKDFKEQLKKAKRVVISTHHLPDGDGLGAGLALYHYLRKAKKACQVYNPDPVPKRYAFLDPEKTILLGPGEAEVWEKFDLWIIVDTNDPRRLGKLWTELAPRAKKIIFLDHHPEIVGTPEIKYPSHASLVSDTTASSIGELLYLLFIDLNIAKITLDVATGLYVSVMTDTNSFRYARTTPLAHLIAAHTIELGVNPEEVYQSIFSSKEVSHLKLLGYMLQNVRVSSGGKIAWIEMDLNLRRQHQATADDTQSFLNLLLLLRDAEIVCLFREEDDGRVRVSIKSKGRIIVNRMAMELGGGGHDYAAGVALSSSLEKSVTTVISKLENLI
jgi:phosphoesterase RecJ-like protein